MLGFFYINMLNTNDSREISLKKNPFTGIMKLCKQKQGKNLVYMYRAYNSTTETPIILLLEMHLFTKPL